MKTNRKTVLFSLALTCATLTAEAAPRFNFSPKHCEQKESQLPEKGQGKILFKKTEKKERKESTSNKVSGSQIDYTDASSALIKQQPKGLLLVGATTFSTPEVNRRGAPDVVGLESSNLEIPGNAEALKSKLDALYFNKEKITPHDIYLVKMAIIDHWRDAHYPLVHVHLPEQKIVGGVLQLVVLDSLLGEIRYKGHRYFKEKNLAKHVSAQKGEKIRTDRLMEDLNSMNRNYFRKTNALFVPGQEPGTTDIEFITEDRMSWRPYIGIDNSGYRATDYMRLYAGVNIGNLFGADHLFDYQFSTAPNFHKFYAHTAKYAMPLPWKHWAMIYGGYSQASTPIQQTSIPPAPAPQGDTNRGINYQASLRYEIPLRTYKGILHEITLGYDFKHTNNDILLNKQLVKVTSGVNISQLMLGYNLGYRTCKEKIAFTLEGFFSPGKTLGEMDPERFNNIRVGAGAQYLYGKAYFNYIRGLGKLFEGRVTLRGQLASKALLPSEQQGVGGYETVRGYLEREVNADNAAIGNFELRTSPIAILGCFKSKKIDDGLQFLAFLDYGLANNYGPIQSVGSINPPSKSTSLASIGPGARYYISTHLIARFDWGFQLRKTPFGDSSNNRIHFGLILSY